MYIHLLDLTRNRSEERNLSLVHLTTELHGQTDLSVHVYINLASINEYFYDIQYIVHNGGEGGGGGVGRRRLTSSKMCDV